MPLKVNIFKKYPNNFWIESGSHNGDGICLAIDAGFQNIISIELSDYYYNVCVEKFKHINNIKLYKGDSEDLLPNIIQDINEPITFWLDGHYSAGETAFGKHESPLIQELDIIKNHPIKNHTIIIDDLRCWSIKSRYGFDNEEILTIIKEINKEYVIEYENGHIENDILIEYIKQ